jgi:L-seryl-tRNA(Ser) seleniumtransferase
VTPRAATAAVVDAVSRVGGGAAPTRELPSRALRVETPDAAALAARLRRGAPPVVARIEGGAVLLDLRTVAPHDDGRLADALVAAARPPNGR